MGHDFLVLGAELRASPRPELWEGVTQAPSSTAPTSATVRSLPSQAAPGVPLWALWLLPTLPAPPEVRLQKAHSPFSIFACSSCGPVAEPARGNGQGPWARLPVTVLSPGAAVPRSALGRPAAQGLRLPRRGRGSPLLGPPRFPFPTGST